MTRQRNFDKAEIARQLMRVFVKRGYEGAGVSELVSESALLRGSLYAAFGSKLGIFMAGLELLPPVERLSDEELDFVIVGLLEVAPKNPSVKTFFQNYLVGVDQEICASKIGFQILSKIQ